jgi:hypothetical protein
LGSFARGWAPGFNRRRPAKDSDNRPMGRIGYHRAAMSSRAVLCYGIAVPSLTRTLNVVSMIMPVARR